jgi:DinB superfamily
MSQHHHDHAKGDKHAVHLALVQRLRTQAAEVQRLAAGLDETTLATNSVPGKWSMKELICHCRRMETIFGERFDRMLIEETTIVPYENPDGDETFIALTKQPTADVLAAYLAEREALCRKLEALTPGEWHRKAKHPQFPHFDVHFQVEYMAHHEAHHIYQLFQRRIPFGKLPH